MLYLRFLLQSDLDRYFNVYIVIASPVLMIFILHYAYSVQFLGRKKGHKPFAVVYLTVSVYFRFSIRKKKKTTFEMTTSTTG